MEYIYQSCETALGLAALVLICCDQQVIRWINRKLEEPEKRTERRWEAAADKAGSLDRITRSRYKK